MLPAIVYDLMPCVSAGSQALPVILGAEIKLASYRTSCFRKHLHIDIELH